MKKFLALALSICMTSLAFAGCSGSDNSDSSSKSADNSSSVSENSAAEGDSSETDDTTDTPTGDTPSDKLLAEYPVNEGAYDVSQGATENMLARAVLNTGDQTRIAEKLKYAIDNNKEVTKICFIGDSITAGSGATSSTNQYVNQFKTWWEENVSYYVDVTNVGIGATDSYIGVHRADTDCIAVGADIIVIEFINDANDDFYASCMDSLVRKCLAQENNPAVFILEPSCEGGSSPQDAHLRIAQTYDIPMISYHDAVIPEIDAGNFKWSDISPDNVHPNDAGHTIMAQCLTNYCEDVIANLDNLSTESTAFDGSVESPTGDVFVNASMGSRTSEDTVKVIDEGTFTEEATFQTFTGGWGTTTGGSITFEITCRNLGMMYYKTIDGNSGMVAVKVDDNDPVLIDGNFPNGWGNYAKGDKVFESDETATHTVTVEVLEGDAQNFKILNWLVS